jgi:SSS family solute:Na+ symporter
VTAADFVRGRFGSSGLALAVAVTGLLATMPYIALQLLGIQVVIAAMGIEGHGWLADAPLVIAFVILAAYTYQSGLRAPALIAVVKDVIIYVTVLAAVIVVPIHLGGYGQIFAAVDPKKLLLPPPGPHGFGSYSQYATLAFGSALALFLYPHSVTGVLSSSSREVIKRNSAMLPAYSFLLGLIALLGYMAVAAGVDKAPEFRPLFKQYGANFAVPALFLRSFPAAFAGFAFAAVAIGALVPAAIMSIAAANLFTRNIYKELLRPDATDKEEARTAKLVSLVVKVGALAFILFLPQEYAIELQLLGGVWMLQTLPAVVTGIYTAWFDRRALLAGWAAGMALGTWMASTNAFRSMTYVLKIFGFNVPGYAALWALLVNFAVAAAGTGVVRALGLERGEDETREEDYVA